MEYQIILYTATIVGISTLFINGLVLYCAPVIGMPRTGDVLNRALPYVTGVYAILVLLLYIPYGVDWSTIVNGAYFVGTLIWIIGRPRIESRPLSENPRDNKMVLSRWSDNWLQILVPFAAFGPITLFVFNAELT